MAFDKDVPSVYVIVADPFDFIGYKRAAANGSSDWNRRDIAKDI
jgi:hypothetical protein